MKYLANRAAKDPAFLRQARNDLEGTLAQHGYRLTSEEVRLVEGLRRQTDGMRDEELARVLADGLAGHVGTPPTRPATPSWRGSGPLDGHNPQADCGEGV